MLKFMGWEVVPSLLETRRLPIFDDNSHIVASERAVPRFSPRLSLTFAGQKEKLLRI